MKFCKVVNFGIENPNLNLVYENFNSQCVKSGETELTEMTKNGQKQKWSDLDQILHSCQLCDGESESENFNIQGVKWAKWG